MTTLRPLPLFCLVGLLTVTGAAPVPGRASAEQGRPTQPQASQGQPGQPRQGPRQSRPPSEVGWEWWKDQEAIKEMALSTDKARKIDSYYNARQRQLKPYVDDFVRQRDELNKMTEERTVDADTYAYQVSRVEALRSKLFESRTVMLYRIYLELRPDQYQKLRELTDRRFRGRGRGGNSEAR